MPRGVVATFVLASLASFGVAEASLIATSREVTVNSYTTGAQTNPSVAVAPDDSFLVVCQRGANDS
jgi:hypothetical protein